MLDGDKTTADPDPSGLPATFRPIRSARAFEEIVHILREQAHAFPVSDLKRAKPVMRGIGLNRGEMRAAFIVE